MRRTLTKASNRRTDSRKRGCLTQPCWASACCLRTRTARFWGRDCRTALPARAVLGVRSPPRGAPPYCAVLDYLSEQKLDLIAKETQRAFNEAERITIYRAGKGSCVACKAEGKSDAEATGRPRLQTRIIRSRNGSNVYLHYVFDLWANRWRHREATGDVIIVRYADDFIVGFEHESDARRFWIAARNRLEEFSLSLHPDKTRLIQFGRFAADRRAQRGLGKPET
jgi:hypothetical protein